MQAHRYDVMMPMILSGKLRPGRLIGAEISLEESIPALMAMDSFWGTAHENGPVPAKVRGRFPSPPRPAGAVSGAVRRTRRTHIPGPEAMRSADRQPRRAEMLAA